MTRLAIPPLLLALVATGCGDDASSYADDACVGDCSDVASLDLLP